MRPKGSRNTLVKIDYDVIGRLAGISGGTAKAYAHQSLQFGLMPLTTKVTGRRIIRKTPDQRKTCPTV